MTKDDAKLNFATNCSPPPLEEGIPAAGNNKSQADTEQQEESKVEKNAVTATS